MKLRSVYSIVFLLLIFFTPQTGYSCTAFCIDKGNQLVIGFNFDWLTGEGLIVVNKRNVSKTAMMYPELTGCQPVSWTSRYGSITFNTFGRELAGGGINEAGLVIHGLALFTSKFPPPDSRLCILEGQWIQYQLDNFDKVEQVINSDSKIRILQPPPSIITLHFFICDNTGNCGVIEFIDGKMLYYTKETMPVKVLSNDPYNECSASLNIYKSWGGDLDVPQSGSAYDRFVRAADMAKHYDPKTPIVDSAFNILANLAWGTPTQRSIVYDVKNLKIYFRTLENKEIRYFNLSSFDFSCKTPVTHLAITSPLSGDVTNKFTEYNCQKYGDYIKNTLNIPGEIQEAIVRYPESTKCVDK